MSYGEWRPYVPVAKRRAKAAREMKKLRSKGMDDRTHRDPGPQDRPYLLGRSLVQTPGTIQ